MKSHLTLVIASLVILSGVIGFVWWQRQIKPTNNTQEVTIVVPKNQVAGTTVQQLAEKNVIRSALAAKLYLRATSMGPKLQNGTFVISPNQTLPQVLESLTHPAKDVWVTIPEGWRREQIAARFAAELTGPDAAFVSSEFLTQTKSLEGQLFPDTYLVPRYATAADVVKILTDNFSRKTNLDIKTQHSALILASLVEREGKTNEDRPIIAGILSNRLAEGWPLQVDASVQYALGTASEWWPKNIDTKFASPYNTYIHTGLPPTPIANPGLSAINAALNPAKTPYWYYIHSPDGVAHYAKTLAEHNANIDKYLNR